MYMLDALPWCRQPMPAISWLYLDCVNTLKFFHRFFEFLGMTHGKSQNGIFLVMRMSIVNNEPFVDYRFNRILCVYFLIGNS